MDRAVEAYQRGLRANPNNKQLAVQMGDVYMLDARPSDAERAYALAVVARPDEDSPYVGLAWALAAQDRLADADRVLRERYKANPTSGAIAYSLADIAYRRDDLTEAESQIRLAMRRGYGEPNAYYFLAQVLAELNRPVEALAYAKEAVAKEPDNARHMQLLLALQSRASGRS